jgi:hypothetical protein
MQQQQMQEVDPAAQDDINKAMRSSDFETYLVSALNDSLIKKSKWRLLSG